MSCAYKIWNINTIIKPQNVRNLGGIALGSFYKSVILLQHAFNGLNFLV